MRKRFFAFLLAVVMVVGMLPVSAFAAGLPTPSDPLAPVVDSGTIDRTNVQWTITKDLADYTLTLSGTGSMRGFGLFDDIPWKKWRNQIRTIVVEEGITSIGVRSFEYFKALTNVTIPSSITYIGEKAFRECTSLTDVTIPNSVTSIGTEAFIRCTGLTSVTIPNSVTSIGDSAFWRCTGLTSVTIPNGVTSIGGGAFWGCRGLTSVTIPNSVTSIGSSAFSDCTGLTSVTIPDSVTSIYAWTFSDCYSLTSVTIPDSVTIIGQYAFDDCTGLTSVTIPSSVTRIGDGAFGDCKALKDVYYTGTEEQWKAISLAHNNEALTNATIHYNSAGTGDMPVTEKVKEFPFYPNGEANVAVDWDFALFDGDSTQQNNELAKAGLVLSAAAENSSESTEQILRDMGYSHLQSRNFSEQDNTIFQPAATFAHTAKNGKHYFAIVVRGTKTDSVGDISSDIASIAEGFHLTAAVVEAQFKKFVRDECGLNLSAIRNDCKFFVTGHSLGGAVANIIARELNNDRIGFSTKNIFGYTYASPKTTRSLPLFSNKNIFNFVNLSGGDVVPTVPPTYFFHYGHTIPLENTNPGAFDAEFQRLTGTTYKGLGIDVFKPHYVQTYMSLLQSGGVTGQKIASLLATYLRIACPVDVEIRGADGQLAASVVNNAVVNNEPEKIAVYVEDEVKYICFQDDGEYTVHLTGTDSGTMDYTIQSLDTGTCEMVAEKEFTHVALTPGKQFTSAVKVENAAASSAGLEEVKLYVLDDSGQPEKEVLPDGRETQRLTLPTVEKIPASGTAYARTQTVKLDGKDVSFQCYAVKDAKGNETNYVKVRDLANALNGTKAQFNVGWDGKISITPNTAYKVAGDEGTTPYSGDQTYKAVSDIPVSFNGQAVKLTSFRITYQGNGYTYYKLRDLGQLLDFNVGWTAEKGLFVETDRPYDPAN